MEVSIFLHDMHDGTIGMWMLYTDVTCGYCGKTQTYATYIQNNHSCCRCGQREDVPILMVGGTPMVLDNKKEANEAFDKIESIVTASKLLGYDELEFRFTSGNNPTIRIAFQSKEKNKLVQIYFFMEKKGKYKKSSLRYGKYKQWSGGKKLDDKDIFNILNETVKVM